MNNIQECSEHFQSCNQIKDPWKERSIDYRNSEWTNLILTYTVHHRYDKWHLGKIVYVHCAYLISIENISRNYFFALSFPQENTRDDEG